MDNIEVFQKQMDVANAEYNLGLTDYECECYANMLSVLGETAGHRFSAQQLFDIYGDLTDIIEGRRPDIALIAAKEAYRGLYRMSKIYPTTKDLGEDERRLFCFVIYWASCVRVFDEEKGTETWNMDCFKNGKEYILREYEYERNQFPQKYMIDDSCSDPTKDDYGYSVNNPIEVLSVASEYQYLNAIKTSKSRKIAYERVSSCKGKNGSIVDSFDIYVNGIFRKKKVATLYLFAYGFDNSRYTPKGFRFK